MIGGIERHEVVEVLIDVVVVLPIPAAHPGADGADPQPVQVLEHRACVDLVALVVAVLAGEFRLYADEHRPVRDHGRLPVPRPET